MDLHNVQFQCLQKRLEENQFPKYICSQWPAMHCTGREFARI